jgi:MFS superfamily sulfate permease-like transporter
VSNIEPIFSDQGDDIEIPILAIGPGWTVDQLQNIDDCDDAFAYLTGAICAIESKIDAAEETGTTAGIAFRRLKSALRWKKAALQVVATKRGKITRKMRQVEQDSKDRQLLDAIKDMYPKEFFAVVNRLRAKRPADDAQ